MSVAKNRREFEIAAEGLPIFSGADLDAEVVCVEPGDGGSPQRCIIRRKDGKLYLTDYDFDCIKDE